jgi:hypothetical protein
VVGRATLVVGKGSRVVDRTPVAGEVLAGLHTAVADKVAVADTAAVGRAAGEIPKVVEEEEAPGDTASYIDLEVVAVAEDMAAARQNKVRLDQLGPDGKICSLNAIRGGDG